MGTREPPPQSSKKATSRLGHYTLIRKLGQGGMGAVYEAIQDGLERRVALKVLPRLLMSDPNFIERFKREAKAAAGLTHPNIVTVYEIGEDRGFHYFSMEYVAGESLEHRLKREGRLGVDEALGLVLQVVQGLAHAWQQGIIHRDLKPANLMLTRGGLLKIADFGLAKVAASNTITQSGAGMGTPYYMSPEQGYDARNVDLRSDIYSLGATFYHLVTGRVPFEGSSPIEVGIKVSTAPLPSVRSVNPEVPLAIATVIEKMLAKSPAARYQDAKELIAALSGLRRQGEVATSKRDVAGDTVIAPSLAALVPAGQGVEVCPHCAQSVPADVVAGTRYCSNCGQLLSAIPASATQVPAARAQTSIPGSLRSCPQCGYSAPPAVIGGVSYCEQCGAKV